MNAERYGELAAVVERLIAETNLDIVQIENAGGPDRTTLYLIRRGITRQPRMETLRRLARALARHHLTGDLDMTRMSGYARRLNQAAGYTHEEPSDARQRLEEAMLSYITDHAAVRLWAAFVIAHAALSIDELVPAIERFARPP